MVLQYQGLKNIDFGENFLWGVSIAVAQNEGAFNFEGRTLSI